MIDELGGYTGQLSIPNSFDHGQEMTRFSHAFFSTTVDGIEPPQGRWTSGPSLDGKGECSVIRLVPMGEEPQLAPPIPQTFAQREEMEGGQVRYGSKGKAGRPVRRPGAMRVLTRCAL